VATRARTLAADEPRGEAWERSARERLRAAGYRTGGARDAVVELLAGEPCALSAVEVADRLRGEGRRVALASVYRALDALGEVGAVQRTDLAEGASRFESLRADNHHHHAVCERCGDLTPFEDDELEAALARIAERLPHRVSSHDVVLRGRCRDCS
jgi:Fur family ferric uptake transcriptional regulator